MLGRLSNTSWFNCCSSTPLEQKTLLSMFRLTTHKSQFPLFISAAAVLKHLVSEEFPPSIWGSLKSLSRLLPVLRILSKLFPPFWDPSCQDIFRHRFELAGALLLVKTKWVLSPFLILQDLILEINELRFRLTDLETEKLQYEKKLKSTKVSCHRTLCFPNQWNGFYTKAFIYLKTEERAQTPDSEGWLFSRWLLFLVYDYGFDSSLCFFLFI